MKKTIIGILAHVDAGKTTLSENLLYLSGVIRKYGRVDHKDSFFDYDNQERNRGITIFSKQAIFDWNDVTFTLIDTPGHVDFSGEMERTLQVLDYAILVVSGTDGIQVHTKTIWNLLTYYQIPTFIFVNKMDMYQADKQRVLEELKRDFNMNCIDFTLSNDELNEQLAYVSDENLDYYLQHQSITTEMIQNDIFDRKLFPCYFGSALKSEGIEDFLDGLSNYVIEKQYPDNFSAVVYKITRDKQNNRLAHMKITGGSLKVKAQLSNSEKVDQIRKYVGDRYEMVSEVYAGDVCAIKGLKEVYAGDCFGENKKTTKTQLVPYITYQVVLDPKADKFKMLDHLKLLMEEDPLLKVTYQNETEEIWIQIMGEIQIEILKQMIYDRFNEKVSFEQGRVLYQESILETVEGIGHYEPLRHYAEVHLLLEPQARGSGLIFENQCNNDTLATHYQNLIMTHLKEKQHIGILIGAPVTDMKITLVAARAHEKHTEGGDFREATYRAVRQGLRKAKSVILEPYYKFQLEIPMEYRSRAIYDIESKGGTFTIDSNETMDIITGTAPIVAMQNYQNEVLSYSKGQGKLLCSFDSYQIVKDQDSLIASIHYQSDNDIDNPTGSIFCKHGAGFYVPWNEVENYMHLDANIDTRKQNDMVTHTTNYDSLDEELEDIFLKTYGPTKQRIPKKKLMETRKKEKQQTYKPECLLVDGYNVIHAWEQLREIAKDNLDHARERLIDMMCNYQGYRKCILILVFDAYKVKQNIGSLQKYHNIYIVYTKEAQTADMYIEHATHEMADKYRVVVATSDALEQLIVIGQGAMRISSRELEKEVAYMHKQGMKEYQRNKKRGYNYLLEDIKKTSQ